MKINHKSSCMIIVIMLSFAFLLQAQTPQLLNYQGKLYDKNGAVISSGMFSIVFAIYADSIGGTPLWKEIRDVRVTNGIFNELLGSTEPFPPNLFTSNGDRYLAIKVGTDPEMKRRFRLTSVAYAIHANSASTLSASDGDPVNAVVVDENGKVGIGTTSPKDELDIEGQIRLSSITSNDYWQILHNADATNDYGLLFKNSNDKKFLFLGNSGNVLFPNGNVGIGTMNPSVSLEINGNFRVGVNTNAANATTQIRGGIAAVAQDDASDAWTGAVAWDHYNNGSNSSWSGAYLRYCGKSFAGDFYGLNAANLGALCFTNVSAGVIGSHWCDIFISPGQKVSTVFKTDGKVGIGTSTPSYTLDVQGSIGGTGGLYHSSDIRLKKEIKNLSHSLDKIAELQGISFTWRKEEFPNMNFPDGRTVGFVGQEVEKVFPELVNTNQAGYKSVDYAKMSAYLVEAIKELKAENEALKKRIESLEQK